MYIPIWLIVLTISVLFLINRSKEKREEFLPIRIEIEPKWDDLFKDFNISSDNSWKEKVPQDQKYNFLKRGIRFTRLSHNLVYDDDYHMFQTDLRFRREIEIDGVSSLWGRFYIKPGLEGYELCVVNKESFHKSCMAGDEQDHILVATIPYSELLFPFYKLQSKKKQAEIDQNLQKYGWTRQAPDAELSLIAPEVDLEHKYFLASYEYI